MTLARKGAVLTVAAALIALLSGCTYETDKQSLLTKEEVNTNNETGTPAAKGEAAKALQTALQLAKTDPKAQHFWYDGYVANSILSRKTTSMFKGAVSLPDIYTVEARVATQPFQYYRNKDKIFIYNKGSWMTATEEPLPIDVWKGYDAWLPYMDSAIRLPDMKTSMGTDCVRYQVKINGADWLKQSNSPLLEPMKKVLGARADVDDILKKSTVKMTMWFGKDDKLIHQYNTWLIIPVPGAGYMDQEINFLFYKYTDKGIKDIKSPEEIEKYLLH